MSLILDLIFPRYCYACHVPGYYFCPDCIKKLVVLSPKYFTDSVLEGSLSLFKYHSTIKQGIVDLKYNFVTDLTDELSLFSSCLIKTNYPHILEYWQQNNFTIIPIPLHLRRLNWRGFNQTQLLAEKLSMRLKLNFNKDLLIRPRNTQTQAKFKLKSSRIKNMKNAFCLNPQKNSLLTPNIILFDDVVTTGSTLKNALNAFKNVGLNHCWFLTIAR